MDNDLKLAAFLMLFYLFLPVFYHNRFSESFYEKMMLEIDDFISSV
jgi:hypothetical protein